MKYATLLGTLALCATAASARPDVLSPEDRDLKSVTTALERGEHEMQRVRRFTTPAARLQALDGAIGFLRTARSDAGKRSGAAVFDAVRNDAETDLVRAYDAQAEIYFARKSLPLAMDRVNSALALDSQDSRALNLLEMISAAEATDIYDQYPGGIGLNRIRERRAATNMPLRNRGVALRR